MMVGGGGIAILAQMVEEGPRPPRRRGRPKKAPLRAEEALLQLGALGDVGDAPVVVPPRQVPQRGPEKAALMRARKAALFNEDAKAQMKEERWRARQELLGLADFAGVHISAGHGSKGALGHGRTWSTNQILRASFTPVSSGAYSLVLGCGKASPGDARSVVAYAALEKQFSAIDQLWSDGALQPEPWAVYCKTHDSTKLKMTLPPVVGKRKITPTPR